MKTHVTRERMTETRDLKAAGAARSERQQSVEHVIRCGVGAQLSQVLREGVGGGSQDPRMTHRLAGITIDCVDHEGPHPPRRWPFGDGHAPVVSIDALDRTDSGSIIQ
jgi:hypothetical protein